MTVDLSQIRVGANGSVHVAPLGSTVPADEAAAYAAAWQDLGALSEEGVKGAKSITVKDILIWQSRYPGRRLPDQENLSFAMVLRQWNGESVKLAFGGGTIAQSSGAGHNVYTPPDAGVLDERMMGIDWEDGDFHYRWIILKGIADQNVDFSVVRADALSLPIGFTVTATDAGAPWKLFTDDVVNFPVDA